MQHETGCLTTTMHEAVNSKTDPLQPFLRQSKSGNKKKYTKSKISYHIIGMLNPIIQQL